MPMQKCYKNIHYAALAGAMLLHSSVAAWALVPAAPVALPQQVLQVSLVAPASAEQQKTETEIAKKPALVLSPKPKGMVKVEKKQKREERRKKSQQESIARPTLGEQSKEATETKSAKMAPLFDAAYLRNPVPDYPDSARRRGMEGKVLLNVLVQTDGSAREVNLAHSSGFSALDEAALDAVRQWRFVPARRGSEIVEDHVLVPVEFKLN